MDNKKQNKKQNKKEQKDIDLFREIGSVIAGSFYDHQQVRIQEKNRIRNIIIRKAEGLGLTEVQKKKKKKDYKVKYSDKEVEIIFNKLRERGEFDEKEINLLDTTEKIQKNAEKYEKQYENAMAQYVEGEKIYQKFLSKIKGISAVLSANLLKELGECRNARYIESVWAYFGLHTVCPVCREIRTDEEGKKSKYFQVCTENSKCPQCGRNGVGESRRKGVRNTFSVKRRTIGWKISDSLMKQRTPFYRTIYDNEKIKQRNRKYKKGELKETFGDPYKENETTLRDGHINSRALRKMVKIFLAHYFLCAKELTKQKVPEPYVKRKLAHKNISGWRDAVTVNELERLKTNKVTRTRIKGKKKSY